MKVALVHDYLIQDGGAERVLLAMHELFPRAPIYTLFWNPEHSHPGFRDADIRPSALNRLPFAKKKYEWYLPFMPQAIEAFDLSGYDVVLSSSSSFAKGAIAPAGGVHLCYLHTPTRFLWQERVGYIDELPQPGFVKFFLPPFLHRLRLWDELAARRPDILLTNSETSRQRIRRYYRRDATVLHPPVDVDRIPLSPHGGRYWLSGGRLVAWKRFDLVVAAFAKLNLPLKVFGTGPEEKRLQQMAGPKTEFLGHVDDETKLQLYQEAIAFLHPQMEDFGITAVEAMAAGKPVIAFGVGGARETVMDGQTGEFFEMQCWEDVGNAVIRFDPSRYQPTVVRARAAQFAKPVFMERLKNKVDEAVRRGSTPLPLTKGELEGVAFRSV